MRLFRKTSATPEKKAMAPDKGLTAVQEFIRREAREARHLFCTVCRIHPPKHPGGTCDPCDRELGMG